MHDKHNDTPDRVGHLKIYSFGPLRPGLDVISSSSDSLNNVINALTVFCIVNLISFRVKGLQVAYLFTKCVFK